MSTTVTRGGTAQFFEEYQFAEAPYYLPIHDEEQLFRAAYAARLPILLKGPTGCGKTRFVEHMAYTLQQERIAAAPTEEKTTPLVSIACHEDLSASDLVGRYLLQGDETVWLDGPLTRAVRVGAICYLDEIVEARKDTTVIIHPLADYRRVLPIEKRGELLEAHPHFLLVISYNPGYQSVLKNLKQSTRQRFVSLDFDYPPREREAEIIAHESGIDAENAAALAGLGEKTRNLKDHGLEEGVSTRLLIYAGQLVGQDIPIKRACQIAVSKAITDDPDTERAIDELITTFFA